MWAQNSAEKQLISHCFGGTAKYQLTHGCIFWPPCFPRQCMDNLQDIYIQDLTTGSPVHERAAITRSCTVMAG